VEGAQISKAVRALDAGLVGYPRGTVHMYLKRMGVSHGRLRHLVLALLLFPASVAHAHGLDSLLIYVGIPTVLVVMVLTPFIKWCSLRWLIAESVHARLIPIAVMELCACVSAFCVVGYWDIGDWIYRLYGHETGQVPGSAIMDAWALIWLSANILINCTLVRSPNGSSGPIISRMKRVLVSVIFGAISPGLFRLFTILTE
jgi:hypothetical protein